MLDFALINMPWAGFNSPSIQCGVIQAWVEKDFNTKTFYFNNLFVDYLIKQSETESKEFKNKLIQYIKDSCDYTDKNYEDCFTLAEYFPNCLPMYETCQEPEYNKDLVKWIRLQVPEFFEICLTKLVEANPKVVGFSCTFRRFPQLILAQKIKQRLPDTKIIFGGSLVEGVMGEALAETFLFIDVVIRGEAERVITKLLTNLCQGEPIESQQGLVIRRGLDLEINLETPPSPTQMQILPIPSYEDYFQTIAGTWAETQSPYLLFETSRGCWWFKHKCKFCGRSEDSLIYRTKTEDQIFEELVFLAERYRVLDFTAVDPCINGPKMVKVVKNLENYDYNFTIWCQGRPGMSKEVYEGLAKTVRPIFLGIESLSTPVLKLMRKGHTALEAIKTLRDGAEVGASLTYNFIYGFPFEQAEDYEKMAKMLPSLSHLMPPFAFYSLDIDRNSVYFDNYQQYGLELLDTDPTSNNALMLAVEYGAGQDVINKLANTKTARYPRLDKSITDLVKSEINTWIKNYPKTKNKLCLKQSPNFLIIQDERTQKTCYVLDGILKDIYLACYNGATLEDLEIYEDKAKIKDFLDNWVKLRIMYEEDGKYLSLALRATIQL